MDIDVKVPRGIDASPSAGLTSNVLPEAQNGSSVKSSHTGVSTNNVLLRTVQREGLKNNKTPQWFALRTTYGREKKAYDYLAAKEDIEVFYPTLPTIKLINGKRKTILESRIPNVLFAYGTEESVKFYVYDNVNLPYLRFYYCHVHEGAKVLKKPLIVPTQQIESLRIICESESDDVIVSTTEIEKFEVGQKVRVTDGAFKGVIGIVARYRGQQRVGVSIDGLVAVATAYIPSAFIEKYK